jgi:phosphoglycolate phosphatase-like HAD superfamily hydrolase
MKIFFDFDDVLFNTGAFVDETRKVFERYGVSEELYRETYVSSRQLGNDFLKVYGLDIHLDMLRDIVPGFDAEAVRKGVMEELSDTRAYVFPDVGPLLETLRSEGAELYVVSFGRPEFQRAKIGNSGLEKYLQGVMAGLEEKSGMLEKVLGADGENEPVWFVDDQPKFIQEVKLRFPYVRTVQVCRPEGRFDNPVVPESDFVVKNMDELRRLPTQ